MTTLILECGGTIFKIVMPNHHPAHEWRNGVPGSDIVNFYPRMFAHLRTTIIKDQINVNVSNFFYYKNNEFVVFLGERINLTAYIPPVPHEVRLVLLSLDLDTNSIVVTQGAPVRDNAITQIPLPLIPANSIPSALIRVRAGALSIRELDITDARVFLQVGDGGSSSVPLDTSNFNNLLSAADDTVQKALDTLDNLDISGALDPNVITVTAGENLSALRAVVIEDDGFAYYADPTNSTHRNAVLGITTQAILASANGNVRVIGELEDISWNWSEKGSIFLSLNGTLTQTPPTSNFICNLGYALTPDKMFIRINQPIVLA